MVRAIAFAGTAIVALAAAFFIVTQTTWFKEWTRRQLVDVANRYLRADLDIASLGGNLFTGVVLHGLELTLNDRPMIAVERAAVEYNVLELLGGAIPIETVTLTAPVIHVRRSENGLNVSNLLEPRRGTGGRLVPFDIGRIEVHDGTVTLGDRVVTTESVNLPSRLTHVHAELSFVRSAQIGTALDIHWMAFDGHEPELTVEDLSGTVVFEGGVLRIENLAFETERSSIDLTAAIDTAGDSRQIDATVTAPHLSLPEFAPILPALRPYDYAPAVRLTAHGALKRLDVQFDVRSRDGSIDGDLVVDLLKPERRIRGVVHTSDLNLAAFAPFTERTSVDADASIDLELERRTVTFDVDASLFGGTARAQGTIAFPSAGRPRIGYQIRGHVDDLDAGRLPEPARPPFGDAAVQALISDAGPATFDFRIEGRGGAFDLDLDLTQFRFAGARFARGTEVRVSRGPNGLQYHVRGGVADLAPRRLGEALGVDLLQHPALHGTLNAAFDVDVATAGGISLDGTATLADSSLFGIRFPQLSVQTDLRRGDGKVVLEGTVADLDLASVARGAPFRASAAGSVAIEAAVEDLGTAAFDWRQDIHGDIRMTLNHARIAGVPVSSAFVAAHYADGVIDVSELRADGPDLALSAEGLLAIDRTNESSLAVNLDTPPLSLIDPLPDGLRGEAIVKGRVTGNLTEYRAEGSVSASNLGYTEYGALSVDGIYSLHVPSLAWPDATLRTDVTAERVEIGNRLLDEVRANVAFSGSRLQFAAAAAAGDRTIDAAGLLRLHPDHRELHLDRLALETGGTRWAVPEETTATIRYGGDRLEVAGLTLAALNEGRISIDGTLGAGDARGLTVEARNVPVGVFDDLLLAERRISGTLDATAVVHGPLRAPDVRARFSLVDGSFEDVRFEALGGQVEYDTENILKVDVRLDAAAGAWLTASGVVPLSSGGPRGDDLRLRIRSAPIDLSLVDALTEEISSASGTLAADVHATGSYEDPRLNGSILIDDGAFTATALQSRYTGLDAQVIFTPALITVPAFTLRDDEGRTMRVAGEIGYAQGRAGAFAVTVDAAAFEVMDNSVAEINVDAGLRITGDFLRPRVEGQVEVTGGTIYVDRVLELLDRGYPTQEAVETDSAPPPVEAGPLETVAVMADVRLAVPDTLILRGTDLEAPDGGSPVGLGDINITVGGDLHFQKSAEESVRITGQVRPVRGTYEFQGREFEILRDGSIEFAGLPELNPRLDVVARRVISGVDARVHVTGTVRSPALELSSTPPLDDADILSLIVFNQPLNQLGAGQQISVARRAAALAAGFVSSRLTESIAEAFEVDLLDVDLAGASLTPTVTIGEQFADGLFLKFKQQFGPAAVSTAALEYQLTDWMRLESQLSQGDVTDRSLLRRVERGGISLLFRFGY